MGENTAQPMGGRFGGGMPRKEDREFKKVKEFKEKAAYCTQV